MKDIKTSLKILTFYITDSRLRQLI